MAKVGDERQETSSERATRPFTGDEYLETLRDGRDVWIYGERVDDVTAHPASTCSGTPSAVSSAAGTSSTSARTRVATS
jgi:aromatic ring hydroxylase